ncbi:hypothetical protein SNE40_007381 [Patella caerulea]|uniref:Reelin domain-containing protein n=1 Tax=Patella caerulea TaxID=87958 RepID=A0AAN8JZN2_PATCE
MLTFVATISVFILSAVQGFPSGPPSTACSDLFPTGHAVNAQTGLSGFAITTNQATYTPGGTVTVNLLGVGNAFDGVMIQARRATTNCSSGINSVPVGTFTIPAGDTFLQLMSCGGVVNNAVAQKAKIVVTSKTVTWTAPTTSVGQIYFRGTFIKNTKTFWTNVASSIVKPLGDATAALPVCAVRTVL